MLTWIAVLYVLFTAWMLVILGLFVYIGIDYRGFLASAEIARALGFAHVYDLAIQGPIQQAMLDSRAFYTGPLSQPAVPTPFLPAFVAVFLPMAALPPTVSFVAWTLANVIGMLVYIARFSRAVGLTHKWNVVAALVLSFPAMATFHAGQVNVWLMISFGEFILSMVRGADFRAGLWLGGLLLKPQLLILFVPGLLVARQFRLLAGFAVASLAIVAISLAIAGFDGALALVQLLLLYPANLPTNFPESMMNWRAFAIHLSSIAPPEVAWLLAIAGLLGTSALGLALWFRRIPATSPRFAIVLLGTLAATFGVSWHSHVHMALPMVAPLLYLEAQRLLPRALFNVWVLVPALAFFAVAFTSGAKNAHNFVGLGMLAFNLYLLLWCRHALRPLVNPHEVDSAAHVEP